MFPEWETARWPCRLHGVAALLPTLIHSPCCCVANSVMRLAEGITDSGVTATFFHCAKINKK